MYRFTKQVVDIFRCLFPGRLFGINLMESSLLRSHLFSVTMLRIAPLALLLLLGVSISGLPQQVGFEVGPAVGTDDTGNCSFACKQDGSCEVSWVGPPR